MRRCGASHAPAHYRARFETSRGVFMVEVERSWAPLGADRFWALVRSGYYDGVRINRVVAGFIAQFGVHGDPAVNAVWRGFHVADDSARQSNVRGTIAFATTGPETRNTQVYINLVDNLRLDSQGFAIFGRIAEGMDVVDRLYSGYGENAGGGMRAGHQGPYWRAATPRHQRETRSSDPHCTPALNAETDR